MTTGSRTSGRGYRLEIDVELPLEHFDLTVQVCLEQPSTAIFGPSGSGKTSLLECLAGLRHRARGTLRFNDETWLSTPQGRRLAAEARGVGWVPQDGLLFPHLDVRRNLLSGAARGQGPAGRREHAHAAAMAFDDIVDLLELAPLLQRRVTTLSGGERQRVALGRALVSAPRLLLLDEPLSSLDVPLRRRLLPLLRRLRSELTVPMILISHDPVEVQALCDELVLLRDGRVVAQGEPRQVLIEPQHFAATRELSALAEGGSYENVLFGTVLDDNPLSAVVELAEGAVLRTEPLPKRAAGELTVGQRREVLLGLRASDILIATERPHGISARNVLPARIVALRADDGVIRVELASGMPPLVVQVAAETSAELGLEVGSHVFLLIKATACRVYGESSSPHPPRGGGRVDRVSR